MQQAILNKLHTALYPISPLASDRDRLIEEIGETVWLESLTKILEALPEATREQVVSLLKEDNLDAAVEVLDTTDVDVDAIIAQVSADVLDDVLVKSTAA